MDSSKPIPPAGTTGSPDHPDSDNRAERIIAAVAESDRPIVRETWAKITAFADSEYERGARDALAPVAELVRLLDRLISEDRVEARARASRTYQRDPYAARERALAHAATNLRATLAGLLTSVTPTGIAWAVDRLRADLAVPHGTPEPEGVALDVEQSSTAVPNGAEDGERP